jgi:hypothetical protein
VSSNYAFNPIAEQALRSIQTIEPQRVNAALAVVSVTKVNRGFQSGVIPLKIAFLSFVALASSCITSPTALACNPETGQRQQMAFLEAGGMVLESWEVNPDELKSVVLRNGAKDGIRVAPAEPKVYRKSWSKGKYEPELVLVKVYEVAGSDIVEVNASWAGANSVQYYGTNSSKSSSGILGGGGFALFLLKAVCATVGASH